MVNKNFIHKIKQYKSNLFVERVIIVSQYCGKPLTHTISKERFSSDAIKKIAFQLITGLNELHKRKMIHRNLSLENILLQDNGDVKLFNYGLFHMSAKGQLVSYPIL